MRYFANFADEIDGTQYQVGEEVKGIDAGTAAYLVANGRIAEQADDFEGSSLGEAGHNTGLSDAQPVENMRRPELIGEARRHFETLIGGTDDDQLRRMIDSARRQSDTGSLDVSGLDAAGRDAMAGNDPNKLSGTGGSFVPASIVAGNVEDTVRQLDALTPEQRAQVREAEAARPGGARKGVTEALDALDAA